MGKNKSLNNDSFVFYRTYLESIEEFEDDKTKCEIFELICNYALNGEIDESKSNISKSIFKAHKKNIENSIERRFRNIANGSKGGAPKGSHNNPNGRRGKEETSNRELTENLATSNLNVNVNVNDNVNVNANDNVNVNLFENYPSEFIKTFNEFEKMRKKIKKPLTEKAKELTLKKLKELSNGDINYQIECLNQSIANCYQGVFPLKNYSNNNIRNKKNLSVDEILNIGEQL